MVFEYTFDYSRRKYVKECVQGKILTNQLFPSPCEFNGGFRSNARVLIDLGVAVIAEPVAGSEEDPIPPHRRGIYRIEIEKPTGKNRYSLQPTDVAVDDEITKQQCKQVLKSHFDRNDLTDIAWVDTYPHFGPKEIEKGKYKERPVIAFWNENSEASTFYIALFLRAPQQDLAEELGMILPPEMFTPRCDPQYADFTKIATLPKVFNSPKYQRGRNGQNTFRTFQKDNRDGSWRDIYIKPENIPVLREMVIDQYLEICENNPIYHYFDFTTEQDIGTRYWAFDYDEDGEKCFYFGTYTGPDGDSDDENEEDDVSSESSSSAARGLELASSREAGPDYETEAGDTSSVL